MAMRYVVGLGLVLAMGCSFNDLNPLPWSRNVTNRSCMKDDQCGDGFCDRGRCAAIWTGRAYYGQRCGLNHGCSISYLCLEGRCRSCASDAECQNIEGVSDPQCVPDTSIAGAHECQGVAPGGGFESVVPR